MAFRLPQCEQEQTCKLLAVFVVDTDDKELATPVNDASSSRCTDASKLICVAHGLEVLIGPSTQQIPRGRAAADRLRRWSNPGCAV
jgi:hypothetical protein